MMFPRSIKKKHKQALVFIFIVLGLLGIGLLLQDVFIEVGESLSEYSAHHPLLGPALFIILAAASVMLGPFTSAPLIPLAVFLWKPIPALGLLMLGWILGNCAAYAIGFYLGHPVVRRIAPKEKLDRWIEFLSTRADMMLIFLFRLASPSEMGYVFGILKYDFWKYLVVSVASELPIALVLIYAGEAFVTNEWWMFGIFGIAWLLVMLFAFHALQKSMRTEKL
jgi:uncharacterized membrane protein YdjX (TVP38/TMEM64 family)